MSSFVFDCPCCSAKNSTFDVYGSQPKPLVPIYVTWSIFATCRACKNSCCVTAGINQQTFMSLQSSSYEDRVRISRVKEFLDSKSDLANYFDRFFYSPVLPNAEIPPEHLPKEVESIFSEAAKCFSIGCFNAAGAMFRLCLDSVTKKIIEQNESLNPTSNDRKTIHNRLVWIFKNNVLPSSLEDLSRCIKDDGNDAAHDGTLTKEDAADLLDFTYILLERIYTEPARIEIANHRRTARRQT
ncbi:hypothetical protein L292_2808 [Acinetobacter junii CIP 107470 = MTCC 11364]|uniref:DUF4145 domain-containing protein n=1 Tax=Acinetobacter junii CIP 107470 = MTCC 11364 TaxID=1217666 RepID=S7WSP5_ACIJU|nr:DUF4145 domain-containing protein [Acinetobacter junii]ENV50180.1 hypothetical protein F953_02425 [Acinetobacter junii CIP 107470 = MTCC 11364]EPR86176.1 hypothetical protein L292_2808 [Acinetobacter junii CIP 107470 = MTCC 11364]